MPDLEPRMRIFFATRRPGSRRWASGKERWRSGSQDGRPGRKMKTRDRWMSGRERKKAVGKPENGASWQTGRSGSQKTGRETKIAVRVTKSRAGTRTTSPGSENSRRAWGSLTIERRQEDGTEGRPPGGAVFTPQGGRNQPGSPGPPVPRLLCSASGPLNGTRRSPDPPRCR